MIEEQRLKEILKNLIKKNSKEFLILLKTELVDTGKMQFNVIASICNLSLPLDELNTNVLVWIYESVYKVYKLPYPETFFTKQEIRDADLFLVKRFQSTYPLKFKILDTLAYGDQYLITQSVQEIQSLREGGVIQWDKNMQRENVVYQIGNQLIASIKYNDNRAREIGDSIANGDFYANSLRWHLVLNGKEKYYIKDDYLIIESGTIAEVDGQHRNRGAEYGLIQNPNVFLKFPILFTIGNVENGQKIIYQEEKRSPLVKSHVDSYKQTVANLITKDVMYDSGLDPVYKFCKTEQAINAGAGWVLESVFIESIERVYKLKNISLSVKKRKEISSWLIIFLNELADHFYEDFSSPHRNKNKWNTSINVWRGFIFISSKLYQLPNWEELLSKILKNIDFKNTVKGKPESITNILNSTRKVVDEIVK